ncbi:MAG: helix-turn-helix domain-containing protein [Xanthomonadales bacterium]|nr:helix-turn-helix domain-containing protein [Xanthomonadales bacterium]
MSLGENIRRLRRDKQWTQGDLAQQSGVKVGHISKLERNESDPKLETLYKIMGALECSPNALLNDVEKTQLNGRMEMALERVQQLPESDQEILLSVIDKYTIAVSMQGLVENASNSFLGITMLTGKTEELAK